MKLRLAKKIEWMIVAATLSGAIMVAQPAAGPLDVQGLDQSVIIGARSRAMGGTTAANANDASALFSNPAALSRLQSFEIRVGGIFGKTTRQQTQEWVPYMSAPGLSLLFESLTDSIIPVPFNRDTLGNIIPLSPWNALQKQYDNLKSNWNRSSSSVLPFSLAAAMPLPIPNFNITAALGVSQAINLDNFYQNNNSSYPYVGQLRPDPKTITAPNDTVDTQWYQYIRERTGIVYGITPGIAVALLPNLTLGGSATILTGSSDDNEQRVERGHLFISTTRKSTVDNFMLDTVYYTQSKVGTSTYSGKSFTLGLLFQQPRYTLGVTLKPAYTLARTWDRNVNSLDTTKKPFPVRIDSLTTRSYHESGREDIKFPLAYTFGFALTPTDKWTISIDYEIRNLLNMESTSDSIVRRYSDSLGVREEKYAPNTSSHPWVNSYATIRFGAEYRVSDQLALRAGYHEDIQAFSPDGSAIIDEPARGGVFSLGAGLKFGKILIDLTYEYSILKYQDIYQSNVNNNIREQHQVMIEAAYRF